MRVGTVTTLALRSHLYEQLDGQVGEVAKRAAGGPGHGEPLPRFMGEEDPLDLVTKGPKGIGTIGVTIEGDRVTEGIVSKRTTRNGVPTSEATPLTAAPAAGPRPARAPTAPAAFPAAVRRARTARVPAGMRRPAPAPTPRPACPEAARAAA
ncbi:hypothetical protein FHS32_004554 [Streptomyces albaduncus]|uniref:Uncharacterized protein n=1 Tax=Streptomyces griseoloalbus TaxID=67303 RepID=A0A7W8FBU8_9ACTN|nr:hypothetical protein [Streptomyces albaduncus]GGW60874.1 hypothetical protein GCM10010340_44070 [Streptomyces albaduncus]